MNTKLCLCMLLIFPKHAQLRAMAAPTMASDDQSHIYHPYGDEFHWEQKLKMTEEFFKYKDHTRLPKHPAVTGKLNQCWACAKDCDAEKAIFNMNVAPRLPIKKEPEPVKVCLFCSNECWMGGWPLVRHHYILAGQDE